MPTHLISRGFLYVLNNDRFSAGPPRPGEGIYRREGLPNIRSGFQARRRVSADSKICFSSEDGGVSVIAAET